jgi:hypothetical protein
MKKYITLLLGLVLAYTLIKFDWTIAGLEAVAATQQVKTGDAYVIGRAQQSLYDGARFAVSCISAFLLAYSAFLFIPRKTNKQ